MYALYGLTGVLFVISFFFFKSWLSICVSCKRIFSPSKSDGRSKWKSNSPADGRTDGRTDARQATIGDVSFPAWDYDLLALLGSKCQRQSLSSLFFLFQKTIRLFSFFFCFSAIALFVWCELWLVKGGERGLGAYTIECQVYWKEKFHTAKWNIHKS